MSKNKNILYVGSECTPYAGTGGLGEVLGSLPQNIKTKSNDYNAAVILPLYQSVKNEFGDKLTFLGSVLVDLAWRKQYAGLFHRHKNGVDYYFIDNEYYFKRPNIYGYYDDGERFAFFSKAVLEALPMLFDRPDILHCNDWHTALIPIYYKLFYQFRKEFANIKNILTIHNIEYQGKFDNSILEDIFGIDSKELGSLRFDGCINLLKGALDYADCVSTVSPTYAIELQSAYYAHGLESIIKKNAPKMRGIINGIDTTIYNPKTNKALVAHYSNKNISGKEKNKSELQQMLGLEKKPDVPVVAIISRLVGHKGLDLVRFAANELLKKDIQLVILGKGEREYEEFFKHIAKLYPTKIATVIDFDKDLAHKIYAGSDMFLMPSKSEPCGLAQMMACRYGTVPIVRSTGGLNDTILEGALGNGFRFSTYNATDMLSALDRAINLYCLDIEKWQQLVKRCMRVDFSWKRSAGEYIKFYEGIK